MAIVDSSRLVLASISFKAMQAKHTRQQANNQRDYFTVIVLLLGTATTQAPARLKFKAANCTHSLVSGSYCSTVFKYCAPS